MGRFVRTFCALPLISCRPDGTAQNGTAQHGAATATAAARQAVVVDGGGSRGVDRNGMELAKKHYRLGFWL
jgi:hypothetical protein